MAKYKNTLQKGSVRYMVFKENGVWYAVGLEFNIVESGTSYQEAMLLLSEALSGYVETARKTKVRPAVLNQKSDAEYERMWNHAQEQKSGSDRIVNFGRFNIGSLAKNALLPA